MVGTKSRKQVYVLNENIIKTDKPYKCNMLTSFCNKSALLRASLELLCGKVLKVGACADKWPGILGFGVLPAKIHVVIYI